MTNIFYTLEGQQFISILLGITFALILRKIFKDRKCIICRSPLSEIEDNIYRINDECYKYTPHIVPCE